MDIETTDSGGHETPIITKEDLPLRLTGLLERQLQKSKDSHLEIVGTSSGLSLAPLLTQHTKANYLKLPQVVCFPNDEGCHQFVEEVKFFDPDVEVFLLPSFDVGLYSHLYPNPRQISQRVRWLYHAQSAKPGQIFVASLKSLLQKTLPFKALNDHTWALNVNDEMPSDFQNRLQEWGYSLSPVVEDMGTYAVRGGIVDIYSPAHKTPIRIELFGDMVESIKPFDPETQKSSGRLNSITVIPTREAIYLEDNLQSLMQRYNSSVDGLSLPPDETRETKHGLLRCHYFAGIDFLLPFFYDKLNLPLEHFSSPISLWILNPVEAYQDYDQFLAENKDEFESSEGLILNIPPNQFFAGIDNLEAPPESNKFSLNRVEIHDSPDDNESSLVEYRVAPVTEFSKNCHRYANDSDGLIKYIQDKFSEWHERGYRVFVSTHTSNQSQRIQLLLEKAGINSQLVEETDYSWNQWLDEKLKQPGLVHIVPRGLPESLRLIDEHLLFLHEEDFFGRKRTTRSYKDSGTLQQRTHAFSFADLKEGDFIVHRIHGLAVYEGLKVMPIQGVDAEFIQLKYKGGDKLYLPVYRINQIQKYSGPSSPGLLDKLGGTGWAKTTTKVKKHLQDIAAELLKLYAERSAAERKPFSTPDLDFQSFENGFPYQETNDQLNAIDDVVGDMTGLKPMDRLICGDVGFGKTEIAMRAAFKCIQDGHQVAVIAPTTILTFQHFENFKKRFAKWPVNIRALNRFVDKKQIKKTLEEMKEGKVDLVIGTHRLFSRDIEFKDLGLLIVDEEQKFGVKHKEKIRRLRKSVDTLALSATPIPRTLNLSLVGIRDLSIITTPPVDRLPTRTFVTRFDKKVIHKAVTSEIQRGGQAFFLHNRVHSIEAIAAELREIVPDARIAIAHGQMEEGLLEKTMVQFFNHEVDVLLCTTIIESGMDIPRANTMFIDNAHQFGLSQLYQLRGRVGRSKERAYCYLLVPANRKLDKDAQERLRVIQENTALGSGIRVAQYDLELRGAGNILGEDQSGHVNAVGYELYMELLEEAVREQRGEDPKSLALDPEINLPIAALIPDQYIPDIRLRLAYYKTLSDIESADDLDRVEDELRDQFGQPPKEVLNLMGIMLIRNYCRDLGVKDLSAGKVAVSLSFSDKTALPTDKVVELSMRENKKYSITPDNRLNIRMREITWPKVFDELSFLIKLCPQK